MADDAVDLNNNSVIDDGVDLDLSMDDDFCKVSGARRFSYEDLVGATNDFSETEQLGKGGFGSVFRGFLKELNCYVAVKRISRDSKQGTKEYASEVKIISQLRHRNIVQLIGWCHRRKELLLVYEFMVNGSLDSHLFKENRLLTWEVRFKIAQGLAWGLLYLHEQWEQYVVHRDIKASNIMLDSNFNPKIGDFGLARLGDHGKGLENTTLAGTIGYVSPEYATSGRASKESDVYSFGVVLLEIACGRKVIEPKFIRDGRMNLREWVWDCYGGKRILEAADPRLNGEFDKQQMECLMIVGLWCAHPNAKSRPAIEKAIHVLNSVAPLPHLPSKLPFATYVTSISMSSSGGNDLVQRKEEKRRERGSGALYKGFFRDKNFGLWNRSKEKKDDSDKEKKKEDSDKEKKKEDSDKEKKKEYTDSEMALGTRMFSYKDLVHATDNFSEQNKLQSTGLDDIYRGFLEELESVVAIRRVRRGFNELLEYAYEVNFISRLRHKNLVQLLGLCHEKQTLFLVFEFMPNGNLHSHLYKEDNCLTWEARYKIARDLASGLLYLHEECEQIMVHRNVKPSKIMLDSNFNAKLGEFGLPMLMDHSEDSRSLDAMEYVYMPPEYFLSGKANKQYDVYSFGIFALEISCGRKQIYMIDWAWDVYRKGKLLEAADPRLNGEFDEKQVECLMVIGLWCAHPDPNCRPSIKQVVQVLNFEAPLLTLTSKMPLPTYFASSESSIDWEESQNNIDITELFGQ